MSYASWTSASLALEGEAKPRAQARDVKCADGNGRRRTGNVRSSDAGGEARSHGGSDCEQCDPAYGNRNTRIGSAGVH